MGTQNKFSAEVRGRAVRMLLEREQECGSRWQAMVTITPKIGCSAETLRSWVLKVERDSSMRPGLTTSLSGILLP